MLDTTAKRTVTTADLEAEAGFVLPPREAGLGLEVSHEHARARVEGVDHHLRLGRPGDLAAPVVEVGRRFGDPPVRRANVGCLDGEGRHQAGVEVGLAGAPAVEELEATGVEGAVEVGDEPDGRVGQDRVRSWDRAAADLDPPRRQGTLPGIGE